MGYEWFDEYCVSKIGVQKDYKEEWGATRYMIDESYSLILASLPKKVQKALLNL